MCVTILLCRCLRLPCARMTDHDARDRLWTRLTMDSPREEVLAAVAESERISAELREVLDNQSDDDIDWRGHRPEDRRGCYWAKDGSYSVYMGAPPRSESVRSRQDRAGEEDQSQPGWDSTP